MAGKYFTPAPGVTVVMRAPGEVLIYGRPDDMLTSGLVEPDWFAEAPKRVKLNFVGGLCMRTVISSGWWNLSYRRDIVNPGNLPRSSDVNNVVAWSECAWRPTTSAVVRQASTKPVCAERVKRVLQAFAAGPDTPTSIFGTAALAYIEHLESKVRVK